MKNFVRLFILLLSVSHCCAFFEISPYTRVNGKWSTWYAGTEQPCSPTCGAVRNRYINYYRKCNNPAPSVHGDYCQGSHKKQVMKGCQIIRCPIDGNWGLWETITREPCSVTCGDSPGRRNVVYFRRCDSPYSQYGGKECPGPDRKVPQETCHSKTKCPVNGVWSDWNVKDEGPCSVTCGSSGVKHVTKNRQCNNPEPKYGGKSCEGPDEEIFQEECIPSGGCPVDGGWSDWNVKDEGSCSVTCDGTGVKDVTKNRQCNNPEPQYGGKSCEGLNEKTVEQECVVTAECPVDGGWSNWERKDEGPCSVTCGGLGVKDITENRQCNNPEPKHGGKSCVGSNENTVQEECIVAEECPVNGGWGPWHQTEIGLCNVKCGNGTHEILHTRYCDNPAPSPTGRLCIGENTKFINESCFVTCTGERVNVTEGNLDWILLILGASLAVLLCITTMYAFRKRKRRKPLLKEGMESGVQQDNPGLSENA